MHLPARWTMAGSLIVIAACGSPERAPVPPDLPRVDTPKNPVVETYHGREVTDGYRWLEDWDDPAVRDWSREQNGRARTYLDRLPHYEQIRRRMEKLLGTRTVSYTDVAWAGGTLFALKSQPPLQQPLLVVLPSPDETSAERVVVDPNELDAEGLTAIDFFVPSNDGKLVAVSLSSGGSESGDVQVYDVITGEPVGEVVPRVNGGTAGGSLAWNGDGTGFFYTRYPHEGERPAEDLDFYQQVWFHRLGDAPEKDRYEAGRDLPRIAEIQLRATPDGEYVLANVQKGDGGEFIHLLRGPDGRWSQITRYEDRVVHAVLGRDGALYLVSRLDAPRGKLLRLPLATPRLEAARVIVPQGEDAISTDFLAQRGLWVTSEWIYLLYQEGGPNVIKFFDTSGKARGRLPSPPISSTDALVPLADGVLYRNQSYTEPPVWYRFDPSGGEQHRTALAETSPADFSDCEVVREIAESDDGTEVPIFVLRRKGVALDGKLPVILYGYGGYGISMTPVFRARNRIWLEQGGVSAVAILRGGGEFGEEWHQGGYLTNKQNVFDDFAAAARRLIDAGYTSPARLAILGGSNGGLLMGAELTQHPEMFRAVVSLVGIYDMLRVETTPNGSFNVPEFGTVEDPAQFAALYAYSPYHHVEDGVAYPSVLMLTGENDPRVAPWQSRKMVARLQAATSAGRPILLRTSSSAGHGIGSALDEVIAQYTDVFGFFFYELGVNYRPEAVDE